MTTPLTPEQIVARAADAPPLGESEVAPQTTGRRPTRSGFVRWAQLLIQSIVSLLTQAGDQGNVVTVAAGATYNASAGDSLILCETAPGSPCTVNLPALPNTGRLKVTVKNKGTGATFDNVSVVANGTDTIDGQATQTLTVQYQTLPTLGFSGEWYVL